MCDHMNNNKNNNGNKPIIPRKGKEPVYYHDYLCLDQVLTSMKPKSMQSDGSFAHDEHLFIITHQSYELWFKQILFDVDSCLNKLSGDFLPTADLSVVVHRLGRVNKILNMLVSQLDILETMTPLDFLDFRDYLFPASGFQSVQFRLLENKLGLLKSRRLKYAKSVYTSALKPHHREEIENMENNSTLFQVIEQWLERTPFLELKDFNFWSEYEKAVNNMFDKEIEYIKSIHSENSASKIADVKETRKAFQSIFDNEQYEKLLENGKRRLSFKSMKAAILISLYRDEPIFQMPFQLITQIIDMDGLLTRWRERHAIMVHRMLGLKIGTGGSSGYHYLKATASHHKIFADFFDLSMFLIPRSAIPTLPRTVIERLQLHFETEITEEKDQQH